MGACDNNEASWAQVLETVEFMNDNTTITILLDRNSGYENFNNYELIGQKKNCEASQNFKLT